MLLTYLLMNLENIFQNEVFRLSLVIYTKKFNQPNKVMHLKKNVYWFIENFQTAEECWQSEIHSRSIFFQVITSR